MYRTCVKDVPMLILFVRHLPDLYKYFSGPGGTRIHDQWIMRSLEDVRAGIQNVAFHPIIAATNFAI